MRDIVDQTKIYFNEKYRAGSQKFDFVIKLGCLLRVDNVKTPNRWKIFRKQPYKWLNR